jgi:hypothetical protein
MSNGGQTPDTLPADFFENQAKQFKAAPDTLPADFFKLKDTPEDIQKEYTGRAQRAAYRKAREPLDILREHETAYSIFTPEGITGVVGDPEVEKTRRAQQAVTETGLAAIGGGYGGALAEAPATAPKILQWLLPMLGRATGAAVGGGTGRAVSEPGVTPREVAKTGAGFGAMEAGGEVVTAAGGAAMRKIFPKIAEFTKINELLGVSRKELKLGKAPVTQEEFVTNPARGVTKSGMTEESLKKMNPLERNVSVVQAKDAAGKKLGQIFDAAGQQGLRVNLRQQVDDVFKNIPDKALQAQTKKRLVQIVNKALGKPNIFEDVPYTKLIKQLDGLTPSQAHAIRMGLDDFANFAAEGTVKTFRDVALQLRRTVGVELRTAVPESKPFDQDYSDLAAASKATERKAKDFVSKTPDNKLRSFIIKALIGGGLAGTGYEIGKKLSAPVP